MSEECRHTPCPKGYVDFCDWADKMSKTHDQIKCKVCDSYDVWVERSDATDPGNVSQKEEKCDVESAAKKHAEASEYYFLAGSTWRLSWVLELLRSDELSHSEMTAYELADFIERKAKGE